VLPLPKHQFNCALALLVDRLALLAAPPLLHPPYLRVLPMHFDGAHSDEAPPSKLVFCGWIASCMLNLIAGPTGSKTHSHTPARSCYHISQENLKIAAHPSAVIRIVTQIVMR
jgi:hypothetical protein